MSERDKASGPPSSGRATDRVDPARVVVVTGLSGAGKSTALHALEDLGYFCIDNLPTSVVQHAVEACEAGGIRRIALGIDARVGSFLEGAAEALERLGQGGARDVVVLFLDASDEALLRRFNETRRPHPLSTVNAIDWVPAWGGAAPAATGTAMPLSIRGGAVAVIDGVHLERARLAPLRARATIDLDTTLLSVHELRRQVIGQVGPGKGERPRMMTRFVSFGFKYGVPVDADLMFDVRFLDNPYFVPELKHLPGTEPVVRDFVLKNPEAVEFARQIEDLLTYAMPRYEREGKSYLTVAIGCTGGRHRSVALAQLLGTKLAAKTDLPIAVVHRDVARTDQARAEEPASSGSPPSVAAAVVPALVPASPAGGIDPAPAGTGGMRGAGGTS